MDGNGRWARQRGQDRVIGHHEGVISVRDIVEACAQLGVSHLTMYTFSTENWNRPPSEVDALMQLLIHTIRRESDTLRRNKIRLTAIGDLSRLPDACRDELFDAINTTSQNTRMKLCLAISYRGRSEIARACRTIAQRVAQGEIAAEDGNEAMVAAELDTAGVSDPDSVLRRGGEVGGSKFLVLRIVETDMYINVG